MLPFARASGTIFSPGSLLLKRFNSTLPVAGWDRNIVSSRQVGDPIRGNRSRHRICYMPCGIDSRHTVNFSGGEGRVPKDLLSFICWAACFMHYIFNLVLICANAMPGHTHTHVKMAAGKRPPMAPRWPHDGRTRNGMILRF